MSPGLGVDYKLSNKLIADHYGGARARCGAAAMRLSRGSRSSCRDSGASMFHTEYTDHAFSAPRMLMRSHTRDLRPDWLHHHHHHLHRDEREHGKRNLTQDDLRHSLASWLLGWWLGNLCLLLVFAVIAIFGGAALLLAVEDWNEREPDWEDNYTTPQFVVQLWTSYTYFVDPGTQTGLSIGGNPALLIVPVVFSLIGFLWILVAFGVVVEQTGSLMQEWQRVHSRVVVRGHTLVLGWTVHCCARARAPPVACTAAAP